MNELKPKSIEGFLGLVLVSLLIGCSFSEDPRLIGKWQGQPLAAERISGLPKSAEIDSTAAVNHLLSGISIEFSRGSRFTMLMASADPAPDPIKGTWSVISSNGTRQTIELVSDQSGQAVRLKINFEKGGFVARQVDGDSRIGGVFYQKLN
ncbi:MAG: hypothetical protein GY768_06740 [Planctomycetaceae bacterium]|nr:hypothetical protein [Planctomycetaceae bacterium]